MFDFWDCDGVLALEQLGVMGIHAYLRLQRGRGRVCHALHGILRLLHRSLLLVGLHDDGSALHVAADDEEHTFKAAPALSPID